jgi:hypothetical protein
MKQIILESRFAERLPGRACSGKLFFTWGLYGLAMAWLWELVARSAPGQAAIWAVALLTGLALLLRTWEG